MFPICQRSIWLALVSKTFTVNDNSGPKLCVVVSKLEHQEDQQPAQSIFKVGLNFDHKCVSIWNEQKLIWSLCLTYIHQFYKVLVLLKCGWGTITDTTTCLWPLLTDPCCNCSCGVDVDYAALSLSSLRLQWYFRTHQGIFFSIWLVFDPDGSLWSSFVLSV